MTTAGPVDPGKRAGAGRPGSGEDPAELDDGGEGTDRVPDAEGAAAVVRELGERLAEVFGAGGDELPGGFDPVEPEVPAFGSGAGPEVGKTIGEGGPSSDDPLGKALDDPAGHELLTGDDPLDGGLAGSLPGGFDPVDHGHGVGGLDPVDDVPTDHGWFDHDPEHGAGEVPDTGAPDDVEAGPDLL